MVVTFCGHKDVYDGERVKEKLTQLVDQLVASGADTFYLGGYGSFDSLAARVIKNLKKWYPHIKSVLVLPYLDRPYDETLYDESTYPPLEDVPKRYAVLRRNQWMVDHADVVVAYVNHGWGGAAQTFEYAQKKKKQIINLGNYEG